MKYFELDAQLNSYLFSKKFKDCSYPIVKFFQFIFISKDKITKIAHMNTTSVICFLLQKQETEKSHQYILKVVC